jgi:hypothetical protein
MAANNRIFYAVQAVKVKPCRSVNGSYTYGSESILKGIQSVGMTTNFNLEQVYQLGQLELYDNVEEVPDIEVTLNKVLDGTRLVYNLALDGNVANSSDNLTLTEISDRRCDVALGIWDDTATGASGAAKYYVVCTGMYVSSVSYNFTSDGNFTEDVTLVGNHKKWGLTGGGGIGGFSTGLVDSGDQTKRVSKRWSFSKTDSVLPSGSGGIPGSFAAGSGLHVNSVTLSCNLGREAINELGKRSPYYRYIQFPVEITSEIEITATEGDQVDADDFESATGCSAASKSNLTNKSIKVAVCDANNADGSIDYMIDLGSKNKLTSVNYTGGDTGGGNATITYSFQTFNTFKVSGVAAS